MACFSIHSPHQVKCAPPHRTILNAFEKKSGTDVWARERQSENNTAKRDVMNLAWYIPTHSININTLDRWMDGWICTVYTIYLEM